MIYKDFVSFYDSHHTPYNRRANCLNCGNGYNYHIGWACEVHFDATTRTDCFSIYRQDNQYLTQSMKDSIVSNANNFAALSRSWKDPHIFMDELHVEPVHQTVKPTIDQWQAWAHNQPGDCACGIKKDSCDYHKSP